ncbi:MAG: 50S ribosomal protein L25/general stress protein Ctc [bacterium]|nr:50S ribosomal protein L25/general stress protein Ctc [bacterium]
MDNQATIAAELRNRSGTGAAREARRNGLIPGVVYGASLENISISVSRDVLAREAGTAGFFSTLYRLKVADRNLDVVARDLQLHPVTDTILHVDFLAVTADSTIAVNIPVTFVNEEDCQGLRRGGVLNVVRHEIECNCPANAIPDTIEIDLAGLDIGDSVHISAVSLPAEVAPTIDDRDFTIATIAAPTVATDLVEDEEEEVDEEDAEEGVDAGEDNTGD